LRVNFSRSEERSKELMGGSKIKDLSPEGTCKMKADCLTRGIWREEDRGERNRLEKTSMEGRR
jgi:hypothetical protein